MMACMVMACMVMARVAVDECVRGARARLCVCVLGWLMNGDSRGA